MLLFATELSRTCVPPTIVVWTDPVDPVDPGLCPEGVMFEVEDATELVEAGGPVEDTPEAEADVVAAAAVAAVLFAAAALSSLSFFFFENRPAIVDLRGV